MNSYIKKLYDLLTRSERKKLIIILFAMLIMGGFEIAGVGSIMPFISVASNPEIIQTNQYLKMAYDVFGFQSDKSFLFSLGVTVVVLLVVSNALRASVSYVLKRYAAMRYHYFSMRLLKKYVSQPYVFFLNQNSSNLIKNTLDEVGVVINRVLLPSLELIKNSVICLFLLGMLIFIDPLLAILVALVLSSAYGLIYVFIRRKLKRLGKERLKANTQRYKYTSEVFNGIKDVKILGRENVFLELFRGPSKRFCRNDALNAIMGDMPKYLLETVSFGGILLIALYLIEVKGNFQSVVPLISLYAFAAYRLMPAMQRIFRALTKIKYNIPVVNLLHNQMTAYSDSPLPEGSSAAKKLELKETIILNKISFYYPETSQPVIDEQTLEIKANTTVGLVGPTGCGKTTMIDIILGLLTPQKGEMIIDGEKITGETIRNWQADLGYVPQSIFLTDDSIARNIAFGVPETEIDMDNVRRAAQVANLSQFIEEELENSYDTIVGERGIRLSGGQRQRIGIARAVYHNPSVLILDEATSALDGVTEQAIMEAINNLSHKKTIIMIAHRLTTVKGCDVIHILEKGRIIDSGNYHELIQRNERFRKMAEGS